MENPLFPGVFERAATSVGGSIRAARARARGPHRLPSGGRNAPRATRSRERLLLFQRSGVRDSGAPQGRARARAVRRPRRASWRRRPGRVRQDDARVCTISIHEQGRWPHTGAVADAAAGGRATCRCRADSTTRELGILLDERRAAARATASGPRPSCSPAAPTRSTGDPLSSHGAHERRTVVERWSGSTAAAPAAWCSAAAATTRGRVARYWTGLWGRLSGREIPGSRCRRRRARLLAWLRCDLIDDEDIRPRHGSRRSPTSRTTRRCATRSGGSRSRARAGRRGGVAAGGRARVGRCEDRAEAR